MALRLRPAAEKRSCSQARSPLASIPSAASLSPGQRRLELRPLAVMVATRGREPRVF